MTAATPVDAAPDLGRVARVPRPHRSAHHRHPAHGHLGHPDHRAAGQLLPPAAEQTASRMVDRVLPRRTSSPSRTTPDVLAQQGIGTSVHQQPVHRIPATVIPIFVAAFAAYAFSWMEFPGRDALFVVVVGLLVVPLQTTLIPILQLFADLGHRPAVPRGLAGPYRVRAAVRDLPAAQLHGLVAPRVVFESASIDGANPRDVVLPPRRADDACRPSRRWPSSSSCSSGTTCWSR